MRETIRNLLRRRTRTLLTIGGIVIGVFAIMVMGAMSEYWSTIMDNSERYEGSNIGISPIDRDLENRLNPGTLQRVRRVPGVKLATPWVGDFLEEPSAVSVGVPEMVIGIEPEYITLLLPGVSLEKGRLLERGDDYHVVIGHDVAVKRRLRVGQTIEWREKSFTIVGILNMTRTTPDAFTYAPIERVRKVMEVPATTIVGITVVPGEAVDVEELARRIERDVLRVRAKSPQEAIDEVRRVLAVFQVIMLSSAIIAGVIGGLSVLNTMIMAVHERTREIGVKKAIGAGDGDIIREFLFEAGVMGAVGGVVGLGLGWLGVIMLNTYAAAPMGLVELWLVTPRLIIISFGFAVVVGVLAGLYPAWRAAGLDPVRALRTE